MIYFLPLLPRGDGSGSGGDGVVGSGAVWTPPPGFTLLTA